MIFSCFQGKAQNASFTALPVGCAPLENTFNNTSTGATSYEWIFGDGSSAVEKDPKHTYGTPGTYEVTLTAKGAGSPSVSKLTVKVFDKPNVAFTTTSPKSGCKGLTVAFKDSSVNTGTAAITKWEWTFGDGGFSSLQNPSHTYTASQSGEIKYKVSLTVTDANGCNNVVSAPEYVATSDRPQTSFITNPNPPVSCTPPLKVVFTNTSNAGLAYSWDYGQGTKSTAKDSTINYIANGSFPVVLTATDKNNCAGTYSLAVNINKPKADFSVVGTNDSVCKKMTFINKSTGGLLAWDYGDGSPGSSSLKHTYSQGGIYSVKLTVSAGSCFDTITKKIVVEEAVADFISTPHYSCQAPFTVQYTDKSKNAFKWKWKFGNDSTSVKQNPANIFYRTDTLEYGVNRRTVFTDSLYIISKLGCRDSIRKVSNDTLFIPNSIFRVNKAQGCVPLEVTFTDSSFSKEKITNYTWDFGDGKVQSSGTAKTISHTYTTAGKFRARLIITNSLGCKDTSYAIFIMTGNIPQPDFSFAPTSVCLKTPVQFTDLTPAGNKIDTWHYTADGTYMSHCPNDKSPTWSFDSDSLGVRDVTLTVGSNGCYASKKKSITVKGPWAEAGYDKVDCSKPFEYSFTGTVLEGNAWSWDFGDTTAIDNTNNPNPNHTYKYTGDYKVILTATSNTSGCSPYRDTLVVKIRNIKAVITSDSAFCSAVSNAFDASKSIGVYANCNSGYRWDFGDTTRPYITSSPIMAHNFAKSGAKNVRLIVKDENGCTDTAFKKVLVNTVVAKFSVAVKPICLPSGVSFQSETTGDTTLVTWLWEFESLPSSNDTNPKVTFTKLPVTDVDKKFQVKLTVVDVLGCANSVTRFIQPSIPDSTFTISRKVFCVGATDIKFSPNSGDPKAKFLWSFGDGDTATIKSPFHVYDSVGTYSVKLVVADSIGCRDSSTQKNSINVRNIPLAGFSTDKDTLPALCYPLPITFNDTSKYATTRSWNLGTGTPINPASSVSITYDLRGTYVTTLTVNNDGNCPVTVPRTFVVVGPAASLSLTRDHICLGEEVEFNVNPKDTNDVNSFKVDFGDGLSGLKGDAPVPTKILYTYGFKPAGGSTLAQLIVYTGKNQTGCSYAYKNTVFIDQTIADFHRNDEIDTTVCAGIPFPITNKSIDADTWSWDLGDGTKLTSKEVGPPHHIYTIAKTYNVVLIAKNSSSITHCTDTVTKKIRVDPVPDAKVTGGGVICPVDPARQELKFLATGGKEYAWSPALGLSATTIPDPVATPAITTLYTVAVTDTNKCVASVTVNAVVIEKAPEVHLDTTIVIGQVVVVNLDLGKGYKYTWDPTEWLSCPTCPTPTAQPLKDRLYTLLRADTANCFVSPSTYNFIVKPLTSIDVPTAFTPNGDGNNDKVYLRGWGIKKLIEFKIYNRWGQLMFETTDINEGWDGYYKGELQNTETYVYHASVETWVKDKNLAKKGTINLLR